MPMRRAMKVGRIPSRRSGSAPNESNRSGSAAVALVHALYSQGTTLAEKHQARLVALMHDRPGEPGPLVRSFTRLLREHARGLRAWQEDVLVELASMSPAIGSHEEMRAATLVVRSFGHLLTEHTENLRDWYRESISEIGSVPRGATDWREEGP